VVEPVEQGWRLLVRRRNHTSAVATVSMSPRGELSDWLPQQADVPLEDIVPVLPAAPGESQWTSDGWLPMEWRFVEPNKGQTLTIAGKLAGNLGKAFVRERTTTWRLDSARGYMPTEIVSTFQPSDGSAAEERRLEVTLAELLSSQETAKLAKAAHEFCKLHDDYLRALAAAAEAPAESDAALADAWTELALARNRVPSDLREPLDTLLLRHRDSADEAKQHAQTVAVLRQRPPADWTVEDLNGQPQRASDYRGRVVVLDFWFAACGPCLRAVPTLARLRQELPANDVMILGCNVDDHLDDARRLVERAGVEYPTLQARDLAQEYGVSSYPTFVILGRDGRVHDLFVAEGRLLHDKLDSTIRRLLAAPQ
jgi:thiol-disulfide isomerase/thioredoxin